MADGVAQMHRLVVAGRDALQQAMAQLAEALTSADLARFVEFSSPTLPAPDQAILKTDAPARHARWLATAIPGAELRVFPDEGHLSLVYGRERDVLDWLAQQLAVTTDPKPPGRA
jgi:hypothetical protein